MPPKNTLTIKAVPSSLFRPGFSSIIHSKLFKIAAVIFVIYIIINIFSYFMMTKIMNDLNNCALTFSRELQQLGPMPGEPKWGRNMLCIKMDAPTKNLTACIRKIEQENPTAVYLVNMFYNYHKDLNKILANDQKECQR